MDTTEDNQIVLDDFQKRFIKILESQNAKYWMINLGIQSNLLWGWKKGNYPGLRYAIEICENEGISANWMFLGIGPQNVEDLDHVEDEVLIDEKLKEDLLTDIMGLKRQMANEKEEYEKKVEKIISDVETLKILKTFSEMFTSKKDFKKLNKELPENLLAKLGKPTLAFIRKNSDEIMDIAMKYVESEEGRANLVNAIHWIIDHR
jgi:hypothetical protein